MQPPSQPRLDRSDEPYGVTLDGNEQYDDANAIAAMWEAMLATPALQRLCASTLLVEQPIRRATAAFVPMVKLSALFSSGIRASRH